MSLSRVPKPSVDRKSDALRRLGVTPQELETAPNLTDLLKETHGGIKSAIASMRFSSSQSIRAFLEKYDLIPVGDRAKIPVEAVALAAGVNVSELLGDTILAMRERSVTAVKIIAISSHPDIMQARVKSAQEPGGYRDRDAVDTALGFLPAPKGFSIINKFVNGAEKPSNASSEIEAEAPVDDMDYLFPNSERTQDRLQPVRQKLLEGE